MTFNEVKKLELYTKIVWHGVLGGKLWPAQYGGVVKICGRWHVACLNPDRTTCYVPCDCVAVPTTAEWEEVCRNVRVGA